MLFRGKKIGDIPFSPQVKIDDYLKFALEENESLLGFSKWGTYLPVKYKIEILKERYFDFEKAIELINNIRLIES